MPQMLNDWSREIHALACEKGWWHEPRDFSIIVSLIHSELSEALEEHRDGRPMVYYNHSAEGKRTEKPEGIEVELADVVIRILDWFASEGIDIDYERRKTGYAPPDYTAIPQGYPLPEIIAECHYMLSLSYKTASMRAFCLSVCIDMIESWVKASGGDLWKTVEVKNAFNKTRPYRHGGKVI